MQLFPWARHFCVETEMEIKSQLLHPPRKEEDLARFAGRQDVRLMEEARGSLAPYRFEDIVTVSWVGASNFFSGLRQFLLV